MILVENLAKYYNEAIAVKNISFRVETGETLVLLGPSGCGKTTTLRMINRLVEPSSGRIYVNGKNVLDQPAELLRRSMGYVLQNNGLFPHYTVAENIAIVPRLLGWDKNQIKNRTLELLDKLQLDASKYLDSYPHELSGGQQQRVGLARALAANPPILLMDEPFGALDPVTRLNIRQEFLHLDELKQKTIILVTHDVEEAFALGDKICLLDKGEIVQNDTPTELLFHPVREFVQNFLGPQQLVLQMKAVKIHEIWSKLEEFSGLPDSNFSEVKADLSIYEALETLQQKKEIQLIVTNDFINQKKVISSTSMLAALNQLN